MDEDYVIYGYDDKSKYPFGFYQKVNFAHVVDVLNGKKRYKFNFDIKEVHEKKNTYINLMLDIGYDFDSL